MTRLSRKVLSRRRGDRAHRVSRRALLGLAEQSQQDRAEELYSTDHRTTADGLAGLPRDYAGIPRAAPPLGPPLPGDLGRPMLNAERRAEHGAFPGCACRRSGSAAPRQEIEAARISGCSPRPISASCQFRRAAPPRRRNANAGRAGQTAQPSTDAASQSGQDRKLAFVNASVDRRTTSPDRLAASASAFVVQAGTVIPAALITGIRSDLPGEITAQVTENVYDSPTGR